jgi:hypothetical protein
MVTLHFQKCPFCERHCGTSQNMVSPASKKENFWEVAQCLYITTMVITNGERQRIDDSITFSDVWFFMSHNDALYQSDQIGSDTLVHPSDALVHPSDTLVHPSDALVHPSDTLVHPSDTLVHPSDALVHPSALIP